MRLTVYADGASRGNPGPAAIGASVQDGRGDELTSVSETIGGRRTTWPSTAPPSPECGRRTTWARRASTCGSIASSWCASWRAATASRTRPCVPLFAALVEALEAVGPYTVGHVPRARNKRADALANEALDRAGG